MAETKKSSDKSEKEVEQLRKRVKELEEELSRRTSEEESTHQKLADSIKQASRRTTEEYGKLTRAYLMAYIEGLRLAGNALTSFADEVTQRNQPEAESSAADLTKKLPKDIYSGYVKAVEQLVDIPGRTIDQFSKSYKETEKSD